MPPRAPHPADRLDKAIDYLHREVQQHGRLPTYGEVGAAVGVSPAWLRKTRRYPAAHRQAGQTLGRSLTGRRPTAKQDEAIAYAKRFREEHGRKATPKEVAGQVGVPASTLNGWKHLQPFLLRVRYEPPSKQREGIAFARQFYEEHGRKPTRHQVAGALGVPTSTVKGWKHLPPFVARAVGGRRSKQNEAITFAKRFYKEHGRKPTRREVASQLGVRSSTVNAWRRLRPFAARAARGRQSKQAEGIAFARQYYKEHARKPTRGQVAAEVGVPSSTVKRWKGLRSFVVRVRYEPPTKENAAIAYAKRFLAEHRRKPTPREVAAEVGVHLSRIYTWMGVGPCVAHALPGTPSKQDEGIAYAKRFLLEHGRKPTPKEVAAGVGLGVSTVYTWRRLPPFVVRVRYRAPSKQHEAIAYAKRFRREHARKPSAREVAAEIGVHARTVRRWRRVRPFFARGS